MFVGPAATLRLVLGYHFAHNMKILVGSGKGRTGIGLGVDVRVLFISPACQPAWEWGGAISADWALIRGLRQEGAQITVATTSATPDGQAVVPRVRVEEGIRILSSSVVGGERWRAANRCGISLSQLALAARELTRCDLVHFSAIWAPTYPVISALCRGLGKPYVVTPHGMLLEYSLAQRRRKKSLYLRLVGRRYLLGAGAVHYTSSQELEAAPGWLREAPNSVIVPNAVSATVDGDGQRFRDRVGATDSELLLGMVGRIHDKKGFDVILPAMASAQSPSPARLVVVGPDEDHQATVQQTMGALGLDHRVTFTGNLQGQELADAYAGLDALVLPSYGENFGMVVVESVAQGTPAFVSESVGLGSWVTDHDVGEVLPLQRQAWVGLLERLDRGRVQRRWQRRRLKGEARASFSTAEVGRQMTEVYERLAAGPPSR